MWSRKNAKEKDVKEHGSSSVVAVLIITAITTVLMANVGNTMIKIFEETMPKETIPFTIMKNNETSVELTNPTMVAIDLSKLQILINDNPVAIEDSNRDRIWSPNEKVNITIPSTDYAIVEVYYDKKLIYKAVFMKPLTLYHDLSNPYINIGSNNVLITDDTALVAVNVYAGFENEEKLIFGTAISPETAKNCYERYKKEGKWNCSELSTYSMAYETKIVANTTNVTVKINGTQVAEGQIYYLRFVAYDITGKPSSLVSTVSSPPLVFIESVSSAEKLSENRWRIRTTSTSATLLITIRAIDDEGIKRVDVNLTSPSNRYTNSTTGAGRNASYSLSFTLPVNNYSVYASATDLSDLNATTQGYIDVVRDLPPTVSIQSPQNGETLSSPSVNIVVSASDDFGLQSVVIRLNGNTIQNCPVSGTSATCSAVASISYGTHTISAVATDDFGQQNTASITVNYPAPQTPTPAPNLPTPPPNTPPPITPIPISPGVYVLAVPEVWWQKILQNENVITSP